MKIVTVGLMILTIPYYCFCLEDIHIRELFEEINHNVIKFNAQAADIAWASSFDPRNPVLPAKSAKYQKQRIIWQQETCSRLAELVKRHLLTSAQRRQTYLLCREPKYTYRETRVASALYEQLQAIYSEVNICIPSERNLTVNNLAETENAIENYLIAINEVVTSQDIDEVYVASKVATNHHDDSNNAVCLNDDADFDKLMAFSKKEEVLRWLWLTWREKVGPLMKIPYRQLVDLENVAARRSGYADIGAAWRDELEVPNLRLLSRQLNDQVRPLYQLLHGVARYYLRKRYGDLVPEYGYLPAHLLGNLWSQNWEHLLDMIIPQTLNLDESIKKLNWTTMHMVKRAEDFYLSLGLPPMTDTFWRESIFTRETHVTRCHGSAADMFKDGDFRLLYCSGTTLEDFYVLHHELGHIQYYMAYQEQPGLFRQANTALHETIGDTIMQGVLTPQHLHRLGLVNDSVLYTNKFEKENDDKLNDCDRNNENNDNINEKKQEDDVNEVLREFESSDNILMLKQALNKIPQIPFALLIDEYRWKYFEGTINFDNQNKDFWKMSQELMGIAPPEVRSEDYFDIGAKFHVPDNTPFIRYFLSSFIQHQLFEALCKAAVYGRRSIAEDVPKTIAMNRCDIYGSKAAGKLLKDLMSRGHSQHWREILQATTGDTDISSKALLRYYRPLQELLEKLVRIYHIPIGW
ncbi:angiotensin-converting enzyme-like [Galleria mellonella]|uniref:Angiotensin-converting enzyme n=1 Tax=Galleria mellonella TaxID=7137 RepID=A0ABM3MSA5_GALME|nr:angiotensin-converting enzyme-like [Galleria mellonella]XP_052754248.1 angiotensin-converting enzyme-like [Galleria mellonella]XP_052754249.1 angiotensin-converting enzyme-like [Galleria mellonella]